MCDEQRLREIFNAFDADKSGQVDQKELVVVLKAYYEAVGEQVDDARITKTAAAIMKETDTSGDGLISVDEFIKALRDD